MAYNGRIGRIHPLTIEERLRDLEQCTKNLRIAADLAAWDAGYKSLPFHGIELRERWKELRTWEPHEI